MRPVPKFWSPTHPVRFVDPDRGGLVDMSLYDAAARCSDRHLQLVWVGDPASEPPVVKGVRRRDLERKPAPRARAVKQFRLRFRTADHDLRILARKAEAALRRGHPVRLELQMRSRERRQREEAERKLLALAALIPHRWIGPVRSPDDSRVILDLR